MKALHADSKSDALAKMYEQSFSGMEYFKPGQALETEVVSISKNCVFLRLNGKNEGVLDRDELIDKDGNLTVEVGDRIRAYFLNAENGDMRFTTRINGSNAGAGLLEQAFLDKTPVEGLVEKEIKGGYDVKIGEFRAFCPYSKMGERRADDPAEFVGKRLPFRIEEFKEGGRRILVSNRAIHEEARLERLEALKRTLREGMVVSGTVASIQSFGAFVDLGGVQALLPVSELSRSRVEDVHALLSVGQEIRAAVLKVDWQNERLTLSLKSLLADPWDTAKEKYPEGSKHAGTVARLAAFGAFVTLEPGLDGLLHESELSKAGAYGGKREAALKVGQTLTVQIIAVDQANRRISLKPASSVEEDATAARYLDGPDEGETYNPFAALLRKK